MADTNVPISLLGQADALTGQEPIPTVQGDDTLDPSTVTANFEEKTTVATTPLAIADFVNTLVPPAGTIAMYGGTEDPTGWLICNGRSLDATGTEGLKYTKLFDAIGVRFGGSSNSDFSIPNLDGRVIVGGGTTYTSIGAIGGEKEHTLTTDELPAHTHIGGKHAHGVNIIGAASKDNYGSNAGGVTTATYAAMSTRSGGDVPTSSVGSSTAHNNMQPYMVLNYIIKY
jgi:microcystin-dependent protein